MCSNIAAAPEGVRTEKTTETFNEGRFKTLEPESELATL